MTSYIGIDPGINGALAFLGDEVTVEDLPCEKHVTTTGKNRNTYKLPALCEMLKAISAWDNVKVVIEKVHAMPRDGAIQAFSFGYSYGVLLGILAAYDIEVFFVAPQEWKKKLGIPAKSDKDVGRLMAIKEFPELADRLKRKKDHNRSDALLLGLYAKRFLN